MTPYDQESVALTASEAYLQALDAPPSDWQQYQLKAYYSDAVRLSQHLTAGRGSDFLVERATNLLLNYLSLPRHLTVDPQTDEVMIQLAFSLFGELWPKGHWHFIAQWWPRLIERAQALPNPHLKIFLSEHYSVIKCNQGSIREGLALSEPIIDSPEFSTLPTTAQASLLHHVAVWYVRLGDYERSIELITKCLYLSEQRHHWEYHSFSFVVLGNAAMFQGDFKRARAYYDRCLAIQLEHDGPDEMACVAYQNLGRLLLFQKRFTEAMPWIEKALAIRRRWGDPEGTAVNAAYLARAYLACGRLAEAEALIDEALSISKDLEYPIGILLCYLSFALLEEKRGAYLQAITHYQQTLAFVDQHPFLPDELRILLHFLPLLLRQGHLCLFVATLPRLWRNLRRQRLGPNSLWRLWRGK